MRHLLDSLATPGGNLCILCFFDLLLLFLMAEPGLFKYTDDVDKVIQTMFSGFVGATLQALTSGTRFVSTSPAVQLQDHSKSLPEEPEAKTTSP